MHKGFASCKALVHTRPASVPGVNTGTGVPATRLGATPQARTLWLLAKSYKQGRLCQLFVPLHDATAQTADFAEMQNQHSKQR